jgi:predicted NUDIX family phosphoesterase
MGIFMHNNQQAVGKQQVIDKQDELILVVKRTKLFEHESWQGLQKIDPESYVELINREKEFLPRSLMELDPAYKQIIPYLVFTYDNKYFLMQRQSQSTEQRLKNKYSLGIGGHIREEDIAGKTLFDWAAREFEEEVNYTGQYAIEALGILNDDSNAVGQVHAGFVFLMHGNSADISVKSELKSGNLYSLDECAEFYDNMETWTQIVFDYLKSK